MLGKMQPVEIGLCSWCVHTDDEPSLRAVMNELGLRVVTEPS